MIEMTVDSLQPRKDTSQQVVLLRERQGRRYLAVTVNATEARAIGVRLNNQPVPRPLTHDLLAATIARLDGRLYRAVLFEVGDKELRARLTLLQGDRPLSVECSAGDAIALAMRSRIPLYVDQDTLVREGFERRGLLRANRAPAAPATPREYTPSRATEEELQGLSAFRDFIDTLDLDDLGSRR